MNFAGKNAVVTGGASGLGQAAAAKFAVHGARCFVLDCQPDALAQTTAVFPTLIPVLVDVSERSAAADAVARIEAEQGPIDILVTAAGTLDPPRRPERCTDRIWKRAFAANFDATRVMCDVVGRRMIDRGRGSIVTVASVAGLQPGPLAVYGPAKAAQIALTQALAGAWGRNGVRVNAVAPGFVRTPALERGLSFGVVEEHQLARSTALGRLATADEVADVIAFLASDLAGGVTGAVIPVDAGQLLAGGWAPYGGFEGIEWDRT